MLLVKGLRSLHVLLSILITIILVLVLTKNIDFRQNPHYDVLPIDEAASMRDGPSPEEQYLARLRSEFGLTNETEWLAWRIRHSHRAADWSAVNDVRLKFASRGAKVVSTEQPNPLDVRVTNRMELPVPRFSASQRPDASDFVFGITTSYARIMDREGAMVKSWARWLTKGNKRSNGGSLVIMLDQAEYSQIKEVERILQKSGIDAQVTATEEPMSMATRYHELARVLKSFGAIIATGGGEIKRWFALVEDDVFFPDLSYLQDRLALYKPNGQLYIGLPSERDDWEMMEGDEITTYGGGAVFFTRSALTILSHLSCFNVVEPTERFHAKRWDIILRDCLTANTDLNMYILPGFYNPDDEKSNPQIDAYETGVRPLLLHHHLERHGLDINMAHLVTNVCGPSCFMQRYLFQDNWVLVNGVSISQYLDGLDYDHGHEAPSRTVRPSMPGQMVIDDMGVDRTALNWKGSRRVWQFIDSVTSDDGAVWQAYVGPGPDNIDSVIVLVWESASSK